MVESRTVILRTTLGWVAFSALGRRVHGLTFGHSSPKAALDTLPSSSNAGPSESKWEKRFADRLQAYANGFRAGFSDIDLDLEGLTPFRQRVLSACREIPYGCTMSYAAIAQQVGARRAARAVGSAMAQNPVPLVVPCHRVIESGGALGGYSAPQGITMKRRLLELEGVSPDAVRRK